MVIHHDKLAYGKIASNTEELSEDKLLEMLKKLNSDDSPKEDNAEEGTDQSEKNIK